MTQINQIVDTFADLKVRIHELEAEATRLRAMIVNHNPTNGITYETGRHVATISWCLAPDSIYRKKLFSLVSKSHLIDQGIVTPGLGYFRLSFRRTA